MSTTVDTATGQAAPPEISSERVHSIFSSIAGRYKLFNALSSMGIYKFWLKAVVRVAAAKSTTRVLDLAAGTGDVSFALATAQLPAARPASIQVTDFCEEMLALARSRYEAGESEGVPCDFAIVDAQNVPYDEGSFDLVTCAYGIRNIPDRMQALREAYRVLAPGGRYVILDFSTPPNRVWRGMYHIYLRYVIPAIGGLLTHDRAGFVYLNDSIRAFPDQETLAACLREVGFSHVKYENHTGGIVAIHSATK